MKTKNLSDQLANLSQFFFTLSPADPDSQPIRAGSRDYGFDFDEEELAREPLAPLPTGLTNWGMPEINPEEFESLFLWFIS